MLTLASLDVSCSALGAAYTFMDWGSVWYKANYMLKSSAKIKNDTDLGEVEDSVAIES